MTGRFTNWQKRLQLIVFVLIVVSSIYRINSCNGDKGIAIMLSFSAFLSFAILLVVAIFPATWRMTDKKKKKIKDLKRYQETYTSVFVILNAILSIIMIFLMWIIE